MEKSAWHKIIDGNLPKLDERVLLAFPILDGEFGVSIGSLIEWECDKGILKRWIMDDESVFMLDFDEVIAWMEIPEYKD